MRIVFMGTPEFALPTLEMLVREGHQVVAVVTQPDKPKGRGKKLLQPPVKEYSLQHGIQVLQPEKIKTQAFAEEIRGLEPDLLVTIAYGKILPQYILDIPRYGCINVHGSLLPKYRGAGPIHWAVIHGEKVTGITTMYMDAGTDTGDMLLKSEVEITDQMTTGELHDQLSILGAEVLKQTLIKLSEGTLVRVPQQHEEATYAPMITKEIGEIDWNQSPEEIHNKVRGTNPWPGAYTLYQGDKMRIWKTTVPDACPTMDVIPGTICDVDRQGVTVACGAGFIIIEEIQFDSCRKMCVGDYICGHEIIEGEILGR